MVRPLSVSLIEVCGNEFFFVVVPFNPVTIIHVLVVCFDSIDVAEGGVHFLLNDIAHAAFKLVIHGV